MRACAKINLGLNVVQRRTDGYHNIETVFLPIPLYDTLTLTAPVAPVSAPCQLALTGDALDCDEQKNLVVKAYNLLAADHPLPPVRIVLDKHIPTQAGLGGGSSDAAHMLKLLNERFALALTVPQLTRYAAALGADCAVFILAQPAYAEGIGDRLYPIPGLRNQLCGMKLAIVKPPVSISTHDAYAHIRPHYPAVNCLEVVMQPLATWRAALVNDFEDYVFAQHVALREVKSTLYRLGAVYASMSGSGSAIYAFFSADAAPTRHALRRLFPECYTTIVTISDPTI